MARYQPRTPEQAPLPDGDLEAATEDARILNEHIQKTNPGSKEVITPTDILNEWANPESALESMDRMKSPTDTRSVRQKVLDKYNTDDIDDEAVNKALREAQRRNMVAAKELDEEAASDPEQDSFYKFSGKQSSDTEMQKLVQFLQANSSGGTEYPQPEEPAKPKTPGYVRRFDGYWTKQKDGRLRFIQTNIRYEKDE